MKNRIELARYFNELGFKKGAEIGVWDGYYSKVLCENIPDLKLYSIDSWTVYSARIRQKQIDTAFNTAQERLKPYNVDIIKKYSMDAVKDFEDNFLDFVYIDGNHVYGSVLNDIKEWTKKVRTGGIVSGHDYYLTKSGNKGVIMAVDKYTSENNYKLNIIDWDNDNPMVDDRQPNWWFIK